MVTNSYGSVTSAVAAVTVTVHTTLTYTYSGLASITTAGHEFAYAYKGVLFFIPDTTNGVFVGWTSFNGQKQYWTTPLSGYLLATVAGAKGHTYTVLGKAGNYVDSSGQPEIWAYLHKGLNAKLNVAKSQQFSFPNTFDFTGTQLYPDSQTGNLVLSEATSIFSFNSSATQAANNIGNTVQDLVNAQINALVKQGYQPQ